MSEPKKGLDPIVSGTTQVEKKEILSQIVDSGLSIDPDDLMFKIPGLANHFRKIAEAQERATKSMPVVVDQKLGERLDKFEELLSQALDKVIAVKIKAAAPPPQPKFTSFSPMSGILGGLSTLLVTIPLVWYVLIPQEVARQRGGDWAILAYLKTPQGVGFRQFYLKKCSNKPSCK
jgi:hypothetical protein